MRYFSHRNRQSPLVQWLEQRTGDVLAEEFKVLRVNGIDLNVYADGRVQNPAREYSRWNGYCYQMIKKPSLFMKPVKNGKAGYYQIKIHNNSVSKTMYIHRLVWIAFRGAIPDGYEIDHLDEDKSNNALDNLCLKTRKENMEKMFKSNPHVKEYFY